MTQRGRKSAASITVLPPTFRDARPEPPEELTAEEAVEWRAVVSALPSHWFPAETHALLVQYCRHVVRARMVAGWLNAVAEDALDQFEVLARMAERETKALAFLATKMRLAQQSKLTPKSAGRQATDPAARLKQWQTVK